jgi:hypothetical protein
MVLSGVPAAPGNPVMRSMPMPMDNQQVPGAGAGMQPPPGQLAAIQGALGQMQARPMPGMAAPGQGMGAMPPQMGGMMPPGMSPFGGAGGNGPNPYVDLMRQRFAY